MADRARFGPRPDRLLPQQRGRDTGDARGDGGGRLPVSSSSRRRAPSTVSRSRRRFAKRTRRRRSTRTVRRSWRSSTRCRISSVRTASGRSACATSTRPGADPDGELGEDHSPEIHVIPRAFEAAAGGAPFEIFGEDYPTPDGTCLRDYIHVDRSGGRACACPCVASKAAARRPPTTSAPSVPRRCRECLAVGGAGDRSPRRPPLRPATTRRPGGALCVGRADSNASWGGCRSGPISTRSSATPGGGTRRIRTDSIGAHERVHTANVSTDRESSTDPLLSVVMPASTTRRRRSRRSSGACSRCRSAPS